MLVFSALSEDAAALRVSCSMRRKTTSPIWDMKSCIWRECLTASCLICPRTITRKITVEDLDNLMIYLEDRFAVSVAFLWVPWEPKFTIVSLERPLTSKMCQIWPLTRMILTHIPTGKPTGRCPRSYENFRPPLLRYQTGDGYQSELQKGSTWRRISTRLPFEGMVERPEIQRKTRFGTYPRGRLPWGCIQSLEAIRDSLVG